MAASPIEKAADLCSDAEMQLRRDLAAAYRLAAHHRWDDGISTHFSVRLPGPEHQFLISPFGLLFEEVTASSLLKIDLDGNVLGDGGGRVNLAGFTIHAGIHSSREDALCVMHCHTVAGVAVGVQAQGLLPLSAHAMTLYGKIGYHGYEGAVIDPDEVPRLVGNLGKNDALMLRNHGTLTVGDNVASCFLRMYYLEKACQMQVAARAGGYELVIPHSGLASHMQGQIAEQFSDLADLNWSAMTRMLDRHGVDYRN